MPNRFKSAAASSCPTNDHLSMKLWRTWIIGAAFVIFPAVTIAQSTVRVMTWNINRGIGASSPNTTEQPAIAKVVNYFKPDIWTIQEVGEQNGGFNSAAEQTAIVNFVKSNLTFYGANPQLNSNFYVYMGTYNDGYISDAIVSRYPLASTSAYNDGLRGMYQANVMLPSGKTLGVFTTHLKASSGSSNGLSRQTEAEGDVTFINSWKALNPLTPYVVTGDWNESEDSDNVPNYTIGATLSNGHIYHPITTMKTAGLTDPIPVSIQGKKNTESSRSEPANIRFDYNMYNGLTVASSIVFDTYQYTTAQLSALNAANGTTFISSDSNTATDHLTVVVDYKLPGNTVSGTVSLLNFLGTITGQTVTVEFYNGSTLVDTQTTTLSSTGAYSVTTTQSGALTVKAKVSHWLKQAQSATISGSTTVNFSLTNGDIDGNNIVNINDYSLLSDVFNLSSGSTGFNANADLDGNGIVNINDYSILSDSFNKSGD